jgi:hypothetical protein
MPLKLTLFSTIPLGFVVVVLHVLDLLLWLLIGGRIIKYFPMNLLVMEGFAAA